MSEAVIVGISSCVHPGKGRLVVLDGCFRAVFHACSRILRGKILLNVWPGWARSKETSLSILKSYTTGQESFDRLILLGTGDPEN